MTLLRVVATTTDGPIYPKIFRFPKIRKKMAIQKFLKR